MMLNMLKGKIHRATVVQAELDYVGSITVDQDLLDAAGILECEKVQIVDVNNGSRFETYTISGERGSGMILPERRGGALRQHGRQGYYHVLRPAERGGGKNAQAAGRFCRRGQPHRAHHDLRKARSAARYGLKNQHDCRCSGHRLRTAAFFVMKKTKGFPLAFFT